MKVKKTIIGLFICILFINFGFPFAAYAKASTTTPNNAAVGEATQRTWTFKATKAGTYKIAFTYSRGQEADNTDLQKMIYTVKVLKKKQVKSKTLELSTDSVNTVKNGQKFTITLDENQSTGYSWSYKTNKKAIKLVEEVSSDSANTVKVGEPSLKVFEFTANKSGTYTIEFNYSRSWDADSTEKTIKYTVKISDEKNSGSVITELSADIVNDIKIGQQFSITLEENPSTGYSWSYKTDESAIVLTESTNE